MVNKLTRTMMIVCTIIVHTIIFNTVNAQSKHAALWRIGDYCLDFNDTPCSFHQHNLADKIIGTTSQSIWYTDSDGILTIVANYGEGKIAIYDKNTKKFDETDTDYQLSDGFFVPMPGNENQVYYVEQNRYFLIDIFNKTISLKGDDINISRMHHIAVHHADCDKVWLINTDKKVWTKYLLTNSGIEKVKETLLDESDYNSFPTTYNWEVHLSPDCNHYTMTNFDDYKTEVYYGDFDRQTGEFTRRSRHDFGKDYRHINNSLISHDNTRIYYYYNTTTRNVFLLEVPIEDDVPNYEKKNVLYSETKNLAAMYRMMYYGLDHKIYILDGAYGKINTIEINNQNESVFTNAKFDIPSNNDSFGRYIDLMASWFLEKPCEEKYSIPSLAIQTVCTTQSKTYTIESPETNTNYHWTVTGGTPDKNIGNKITVTWQDTEGDGKITVYAEDKNTHCASESVTYTFKIHQSPSAEFDNTYVCDRQPLNIISSGDAPFEIQYTINGESKTITTTETEYKLPDIPGQYKLTKIKDATCEAIPKKNNNSEVAPKMKPLKIICE